MRPVLTHIALHVANVAESVAFYRDICALEITHERGADTHDGGPEQRIVWLAEPGRERDFVFVLIPGGPRRLRPERDFSHLGFALPSRHAVDGVAERARVRGALRWAPRQEPYPVGYYCGVEDPDGNMVEFSYGQPLGPGVPKRGAPGQDTPGEDAPEQGAHDQLNAGDRPQD